MADPNKGRGRGLRIFEALKKMSPDPTPDPTPVLTPVPSAVGSGSAVSTSPSSTAATSSTGGGRGKMLAMLRQNQGPAFAPASDVGPSSLPPAAAAPPPVAAAAAAPKGAGRGIKLLQQLQLSKAQSNIGQGDVAALSQKMAGSSISSALPASMVSATTATTATVAKNKPLREIKDTPPVVMKGERGQKVNVTSNFVYLKFEENCVFEYEVLYEPNVDHIRLRYKLLGMHSKHFREKTFDGTTLYVPHMLPPEALNLVSVNPHDDTEIKITIKFRRTRRLSEMIHIYNVLFKQIMKDLELIRFNRQHFSKQNAIQIPQHKLEVWPGYVTAVDEYEGGLMLTLDSTHRVLRTQNVYSIMNDLIENERGRWKQALQELLVGTSVMTTYNNKLFRVDTIDVNITPQSTFQKNGEEVTYVDYYKKAYGIDIKDWAQPMLICRETKKLSGSEEPVDFMICLVPELCQLTGLSDGQRSNFTLMKDVATYTRITPNQRHAAFKKFIDNVMNNERAKARLAGWGLSLAPETINLVGRTLSAENLYFGNNIKVSGKPTAEWNNEVTRNPVMQAVDINKWVIMYTNRDGRVAKDFLQTIRQCAGPTGIRVNNPDMVELPNDRNDTYVTKLKQIITGQIQIVVCICPTSRDDRYATIKKICCAENPVPSQVINSRTLMNPKKVRAVTQKILLQMNCKLGGTLWELAIPCKTAMVVGMDSYHDAGRKKSSVYTFISSFDRTMTRWFSQAVFQEKSQEIVDSIKQGVVKACNFYLKTNGMLPERIIMYRDGVGDGQLKQIRDYEIPQMKISLGTVKDNYSPSLTYIIVQKRINTRIFLRTSNGFDNPAPGTVVDHDITRRDWYDFLIASQKVNQGTVTPTHYIVIHDDNKLSPDQCQKLTYKLCHLYYNWPGTVRVPAPCQYAHKLAYLVGQSIHQQPSEQLTDKLFFL